MLRPIICPWVRCFQSDIFSLRWLMQLFSIGVYQRWICWHLPIQLSASIITPWQLPYIWWPFELNSFNHPWTFQVSYVFNSPALVPLVLSKFLAEHVKGQLRLLILVAPCWIEAPWLPTVLSMLADISQWCPIIKDLIMDVSVGPVLNGLLYLHLTLWLLRDKCSADRGSFPQSVRQW